MTRYSLAWNTLQSCMLAFQKQVSKANINDAVDDADAWNRPLAKPDDQLELTEAELAEEMPKSLTTTNTNVSRNLCVYSYSKGEYIPVSVAV